MHIHDTHAAQFITLILLDIYVTFKLGFLRKKVR